MSLSQAGIDELLAEASALESSAAASAATLEGVPPPEATQPGLPTPAKLRQPQIERILGIEVPVAVMLAEQDMPIEAILQIRVGTIIEFDVPFDSDLSLHVANRQIGVGQAVKVGENFGLRVSNIDTLEHRIDAMGGE